MNIKKWLVAWALMGLAVMPACILEVHPDDDYGYSDGNIYTRGDTTLHYLFEGDECDHTFVGDIEVILLGYDFGHRHTRTLTCASLRGGVTLTGLMEDEYEILVRAWSDYGDLLYELNGHTLSIVAGQHHDYDLDVPSVRTIIVFD